MPERHFRNHMIFSPEQAERLPPDQPRLHTVSFADWTYGHHQMMHSHADVAEVLLILSGRGWYSIGLNRRAVQAGDVVLCNSGVPHDEFPETDTTYRTMCIGVKRLALDGLAPGQLVAGDADPIFHQPAQFSELAALFTMMEAHAGAKTERSRMFCQHLMLAALELVRQMTERAAPAPAPAEGALFARVEAYIDAHYSEDLSIDRLGKIFYVSPYHLAHLFKEHTGYTIKQYILRRRIGEAQTRLYGTADSIQAIAAAVGFEDPAYFSRLFSKFVGMPPSEYREYCGNK